MIDVMTIELQKKTQQHLKDSYVMFSQQSPLDRTKAEIIQKLEASKSYRMSVLTNVSTFSKYIDSSISKII